MEREDIVEEFAEFFHEFYKNELAKAISEEKKSIAVDFSLLDKFDVELADYLLENPEETIPLAEEAIKQIDTGLAEAKLRVRFFNLPESKEIRIRNIRSEHIGKMIVVDGIVKRASEIRPEVSEAIFQCPECGNRISVIQKDRFMRKPVQCDCGCRKGFRLVDQKLYDARWITIEEPFEITTGERPSEIMVFLKEDLTSPKMQTKTDPGNRIKVVGILKQMPRMVRRTRSRQLEIYVDANFVESIEVEWEELEISPEDEKRIVELAKDPRIFEKLVNSLAPTMYGMDEVKEAIILQMFGGEPHLLKDGTRIRGDIHILLVGDPASGKCVHGDTKVVLSDGRIEKIRDIVENGMDKPKEIDDGYFALTNHNVPSLLPSGKIGNEVATILWKRKSPEFMYEVETETGTKITTTPSHLFLTIEDGNIVYRKAKDLSPCSFIGTPRFLPINGSKQKIDVNAKKRKRAKKVNFPKFVTPELCKFIGYVIGEGYVQKKNTSGYVSFTNNNPEVLEDFKKCAKKVFGDIHITEVKPRKGKSAKELIISSIPIVEFLEQLEFTILKKSREKRIPKIILKSENESVRELLKALFESEVSIKKDARSMELTSASEELIEQIRVLLLRFGILSQIHPRMSKASNSEMEKRKYYRIRISGANFEKFFKKIGFVSKRREEKARKVMNAKKHTNIDTIPSLSKFLKRLRERLRLTQFDMGISRSTYQHFDKGDRNPTRWRVGEIIKSLRKRVDEIKSLIKNLDNIKPRELQWVRNKINISQAELAALSEVSQTIISQYELGKIKFATEKSKRTFEKIKKGLKEICLNMINCSSEIDKLNILLNSNIFWDKVVRVNKVKSREKWVYDLQVDKTHNFIANNVIVHNSQLMQLASRLIPRGKYVSGRGVSAAGLTATVVRDEEFLGGWVLEAGALVMANKSVCCLHPSSKVILGDEILPISKVFDEKKSEKIICNKRLMDICKLKSFTPSFDIHTLSVSKKKASLIRRREYNGKILRMKLNSGFEIRLTPEHLLIDGDKLAWKEARNFKEGEYVLAPLKLPSKKEEIFIFDLIPNDWKVCLTKEEKEEIKKEILKKYKSIAQFNRKIKLRKEILNGGCQPTVKKFKHILKRLNLIREWKRRKLKYGRKHGSIRLKISEVVPALGYILGFAAGDGYINREMGHCGIRITQSIRHKKYIEEFIKNWDKVFPEKLSEYEDKREGEIKGRKVRSINKVLYHGSNLIVLLYDKLIGKSFEKILSLPDEVLKAFVAGLFDSDGCISIKRSKKKEKKYEVAHVEFLLSKENLVNLNFILALRRLNVYSKLVKTDKKVDIIRITGREDVLSLKNSILKYSRKIDVEIPKRIHKVSSSSNKLPKFLVSEVCKKIVDEINTTLLNNTNLRNVYSYINLKYQPSRDGMRKIVDRIGNNLDSETKEKIRRLTKRDFFLDKIVEIEVEDYHGFVYDLYVPGTHSFVADGIFVHNCIDEFSKVSTQDQVALQEAMSLGTISIAKASIVATLPAQTAILAGGNPKLGRFDPYIPIKEQIDISSVLLSRFDLKFALRDIPNPDLDAKMADHILKMRHFEEEMAKPVIEPEFLRKYIAYARTHVHPVLTEEAGKRIKEFYLEMRGKAGEEAPVAITLRQYEALIRLAEASAKVRLSSKIELEDAERAINLMKVSLRQFGFEPETGMYDIDRAEGQRVTAVQRSKIRIVLDVIDELGKIYGKEIPMNEISRRAKEEGVDNPDEILRKMQQEGMLYSPRVGFVSKT